MEIEKIPPLSNDLLNVIIETPKGSQIKYAYEPEYKIFKLKKALPMGTVFPFDFGFIPNTLGEDGDPLDVLVLMDQHAYPGTWVECRLIGMLQATQKERDGKETRNDRFVAVAQRSVLYKSVARMEDMNQDMTGEIENFFIDYNKHAGKDFAPLGWVDKKQARESIEKAIK